MDVRSFRYSACILLAAVTVSLLVPAVSAGYKSFGDAVDGATTDKDVTHLLLNTVPVAPGSEVTYSDDDSSGTVGTAEAVYIDTDGSGTISPLDILIRGTVGTKGSFVKSTDTSCCGAPLTVAPGGWAYADVFPCVGTACATLGPDGLLNLGDPVFLDLDGSGTVTTNDIKIVSKGTGTVPTTSGSASFANVAASDAQIGAALTPFAGYRLAYFDADGSGTLGFGDSVYVDTDANMVPNPGDIRIGKPTTGSATLTSGTMPDSGSSDTVFMLTALGGAALAYDDTNVDNIVNANEGLYLDVDASGTVTADDVRFTLSGASASTISNKQVLAADTDVGTVLKPLPGSIRYDDVNNNGIFDAKDVLFIEVKGAATVQVGDYRLAKGPSSTSTVALGVVTASATDLTHALTALAGFSFAYVDVNGGGAYGRGDVVYIDTDSDGMVTTGDARLDSGPSPMTTAGRIITDADDDVTYCYDFTTFASPAAGTAFVDQGNPANVGPDEVVYFDRAADGQVSTNDVRLATVTGTPNAGTFVLTANSDNSDPLTAMPAGSVFAWADSNGDGVYSMKGTQTHPDTVYIDMGGSGTVTVGDLRVTDASIGTGMAGSKVTGSASGGEINQVLTPFVGATIKGFDSNGDGTFTSADALYFNADDAIDTTFAASGCVTPGDVRLSGGASTSGGGGGGGGGSPPPPPPPPAATTPVPTTPEPTTSEPTPTTSTPAPPPPPPAPGVDIRALNIAVDGTISVQGLQNGNQVTWQAQPGAAGYQVWRDNGDGQGYVLVGTVSGGTAVTFTDPAGTSHSLYIVSVYAKDANGNDVGLLQSMAQGMQGGDAVHGARATAPSAPPTSSKRGPGFEAPLMGLAILGLALLVGRRRA